MSSDDELLAEARAFAADDPDPETRRELEVLIARADVDELRARFSGKLEFGTAGLRGAMGAGPARMNRAMVARATAGLCAHLLEEVAGARERGLCIGYDGRHQSRRFAREAAEVATGAGFAVHLFAEPVPTPLLAFSLLDRGAAAAAMVTASHNPAGDNGFKVYWDNGAQIVPPHDTAIASAMDAVGSLRALPRGPVPQPTLDEEVTARYLALVGERCAAPRTAPLRIAYTALHGVGEKLLRRALAQAGFDQVYSVAEQAVPDPDFPTVAFPNPEERGAMDRVLALAESVDAELVLANDPDADRLAVAVRSTSDDAPKGAIVRLTGNDVGLLLADECLRRTASQNGRRLVLSSIVSSPMLAAIAAEHGVRFEPTLTGFKWICNRASELARDAGTRLIFGFEEALGYSVFDLVRDKDGISAGVVVAQLASALKARGRSLLDRLDELFARHGVWQSAQVSLRLDGGQAARAGAALMARAREARPRELAGVRIRQARDLAAGDAGRGVKLPPSDLLIWELEDGSRVALRPSGTEPKLKLYLDVCARPAAAEPLAAAKARAARTRENLEAALRSWVRTP